MSDLKINLTNQTEKQIAKELRTQLKRYDENPLSTWRWWSGFIWGAILVAAMGYGDVRLCVGQCNNAPQKSGLSAAAGFEPSNTKSYSAHAATFRW